MHREVATRQSHGRESVFTVLCDLTSVINLGTCLYTESFHNAESNESCCKGISKLEQVGPIYIKTYFLYHARFLDSGANVLKQTLQV
jgi:hypothetical protein